MTVHLHIERLVLDGLDLAAHEGAQVQVALKAELLRLLAGQAMPTGMASVAMPSLPAAAIVAAPGQSAAQLGRQIAHSLYGGLA